MLVSFVIAGCGGGGGGDDSNGNNNPPQGGQNYAPSTVSGHALTLQGSGIRRIEFVTANMWTEQRDGVPSGGTYEYSANGNTAEVVLTDSAGDSRVQLQFNSATSGSYRFVSEPVEGSFILEPIENSGDPEPGGPGSGPGAPPSSLEGRILHGTRTYTSTGPVGQTHVYTFTGSTFHDSDPPEESDGSYIYELSGNRASLTLNYHAPRVFNGDRHEIQMRFQTSATGTFESIYTRRDGTMIAINGTFTIE